MRPAVAVRRILFLGFVAVAAAGPAGAAGVAESVRFVSASPDFSEIVEADGVVLDLRYATADNFVGRNLYGEFDRAFLHRIAAAKLRRAAALLRELRPEYRLVVFDALRPRSVQTVLWEQVAGTDRQRYVANPKGGSIHNYGFAVDLSIVDGGGAGLDMGTGFDDFTELAQPRLEGRFLREGRLTGAQVENRRLLRRVMEEAGFTQLALEWWHFDALPKSEVRANYRIIE